MTMASSAGSGDLQINDMIKKYSEARKLSDEESKNDPETNPYKSKYKARELLHEIRKELENSSEQGEDSKELKFRLALIQYQLGVNFLETEETSSGHEHLTKADKILKEYRLDSRCVTTALNTLNQLAILWCTRRDHSKAMEFLKEAQTVFHTFKKDVSSSPSIIHELLLPETDFPSDLEREREFENCYTLTLYYLAQVFEKQGDKTLAARYCHMTLQRQLSTFQYDPIDWALNCATLSQYYITQDDYTKARHCLASATRIFSEAENKPIPEDMERDDRDARQENITSRKADINRCWIKYCISLLQFSKEHELNGTLENASSTPSASNDRIETPSIAEDEQTECGTEEDKLADRFESLELTSLESQVRDEVVRTFDEARSLFLPAQKWINAAKEYYVIDGFVSDHIELVKDHSQLFKLISFFEIDFERRCKMHKRRVDMLADMLDGLNRQHFLTICRQLMFELAETYSEMMDLKIALAEKQRVPPTHKVASKINVLCKQSLTYYQDFIHSTKDHEGKLPDKFESDVLRPVLVAYFCVGRLYSKFVTPSPPERLDYLQLSLDSYKAIVDYCDKNPDHKDTVKDELDLCREMTELIPLRMANIRGEIQMR
ncbi:KIF1-binding protein homolog isoform X1 [Strongylocentrotus purpuratus]|uniref:KIF-binding protein n=1 Tax=Strongylocentrotus purpuratus TaxID=7668 RepID=A0A7M7MZR1_STRPU|nr:KIF1-binding protein homolog isoform X1 [Strongylocentrotus purpuratus]